MSWRTVVMVVVIALIACTPAAAQKKKEKRRRSYTVTELVYRKLEKTHELLGEEQYDEARKVLDRTRKRRGLNPHELALIYQTYGYIESSQGQYKKAAVSFEKCLAQSALPPAGELDIQYDLAQLYLADERFDKAATMLEDWLTKAENPSSQAYYLLAVAYVRQDRMDLALQPALEAVQRSAQPKEPWLQLLLAVYFDKKEYRKAAELLEQLITRFSKKTYWVQLAAVYAELGREEESLAVTQLAYAQGLLNRDRELRNLARMYLYHEIPYRAARVLEKGLADETLQADADAWELLADSWLSAREYGRALDPLARAARLSNDGNLYVRLAQVYVEREDWASANRALQDGLEKGGLKDPGQAFLLLGISYFSAERFAAARRAFDRAREHNASRKAASQWLEHIERERAGY